MNINVPAWLTEIARKNETAIYLVGGYVRNCLCGLPPSDIDIAGRALPEDLVLPHGFFFATRYKRMGTALIKHRRLGEAEAEYTPFRTEEYAPGGGHTPTKVAFGADIRDDAARRDFTVNSIYYNILTGEIVDFYGGAEDAKNRILRAYDPAKVFSSDGLRLMRLVRIAAETGFTVDEETERAAKACAPLLADITPNRKRDELLRILNADTAYGVSDAHYRGLTMLRDYGFLPFIMPELADLDGLAQPIRYHKYDALEHTFRVVRACPPHLRLAALMHDIGKAECVRLNGNMHGHEVVGAEMTARILGAEGMKLPSKETDRICRLVRNHMYDKERKTRDGKMLLFCAREFDILDDLAVLMNADGAGKGMGETEPCRLPEFKARLIESGAPVRPCDLKINGADLRSMGYEGEEIKNKLTELFSVCVLNPAMNRHKKLMKLAEKE